MLFALMTAALAAPETSSPSALCGLLDQTPIPLVEVTQALGGGADPDDRCPRTVTVHVGPSFSAGEVILGLLLPPVGLAMLLGSSGHEEQRTVHVTPLEIAISRRDAAVMDALLSAGADPLRQGEQGQSPMAVAIAQDVQLGGVRWTEPLLGRLERIPPDLLQGKPKLLDALLSRPDLLRALLARGLDSEGRDEDGTTWLVRAIRRGDTVQVQQALAAGADPNLSLKGKTPLLEVVQEGKPELLPVLLEAGARLELASSGGESLLTHAVHSGSLPMLQALLQAGLSPNPTDEVGEAPLEVAVRNGQIAMVRALLQAGAQPVEGVAYLAAQQGDLDLLDLLLDHGADPDAPESFGRRPLHAALELLFEDSRQLPLVERLLQAGADPSLTDSSLFRAGAPIDLVIERGDLELLQRLLPAVAAERRDDLLLRALLASEFKPELAELLAEPLPREALDRLLVSVSGPNHQPARDFLRARGARYPEDCLAELIPYAELAVIEQALADGARVDRLGSYPPRTPAELALERGDARLVALLVERGARLPEPEASSVLSYLLWKHDLTRVELALDLGARPSGEDIESLALDAQHHLLRRMAKEELGLPLSVWRPGRYRAYDPGTRQVIREIWEEKKAQRR